MSEQSAKPYLVRALYEWCVEQGYTPYMAVRVNANTRVPMSHVRDGEIVLNVGPMATHQLTMDNEWVLFNARFNGESQELAVPFSAVAGIFAKETGYGMGFQTSEDEDESDALAANDAPASAETGNKSRPIIGVVSSTAGKSEQTDGLDSTDPTPPPSAPTSGVRPSLKIVK